MLMVNVPSVSLVGNTQVVTNDAAPGQPWSTFQGMNAQCWKLYGDVILYGDSDGILYQAWVGNKDKVLLNDTLGTTISSAVQQAYSYFGGPAAQKQIGMYRLNFTTNDVGGIQYATNIEYDFAISPLTSSSTFIGTDLDVWNSALWDTALWSSSVQTGSAQWIQAVGLGNAVSLSMSMESSSAVTWISTDYSHKVGGVL